MAGSTGSGAGLGRCRYVSNDAVTDELVICPTHAETITPKDSRRLSSPYAPASIANLQPACLPEEVEEFLSSQDLLSVADKPIRVTSALPHQALPQHLPPDSRTTTLRRLLTHHLDLRASPRKSFFEWLRRLSADEREQERLDEFISDPVSIFPFFPFCPSYHGRSQFRSRLIQATG